MKRLIATLAVLCACGEAPAIHRERIAREAMADLTGIVAPQNEKWARPPPPAICEIGAKKYCFGILGS